jgi:hypothetical protein
MAPSEAVPAGQTIIATKNPVDPQVDTIWQMALASFAANNESIVLPLDYAKLLSPEVIEELKVRLRYVHLTFTSSLANMCQPPSSLPDLCGT